MFVLGAFLILISIMFCYYFDSREWNNERKIFELRARYHDGYDNYGQFYASNLDDDQRTYYYDQYQKFRDYDSGWIALLIVLLTFITGAMIVIVTVILNFEYYADAVVDAVTQFINAIRVFWRNGE